MDVRFDPLEHKYYNVETGEEYKSVTTFIGEDEPFDRRDAVLRAQESRSSIYFGMGAQEILDKWAEIRDEGTALHREINEYLGGKQLNAVPMEYRQAVYYFGKGNWGGELKSEVLLWSHTLKLAGTCDVIVYKGTGKEDVYTIHDIKTSTNINEKKLIKFSKQLWLYRELYDEMLRDVEIEDLEFLSVFEGIEAVPHRVKVGGIIHYKDFVNNRKSRPEFVKALDMAAWVEEIKEAALA